MDGVASPYHGTIRRSCARGGDACTRRAPPGLHRSLRAHGSTSDGAHSEAGAPRASGPRPRALAQELSTLTLISFGTNRHPNQIWNQVIHMKNLPPPPRDPAIGVDHHTDARRDRVATLCAYGAHDLRAQTALYPCRACGRLRPESQTRYRASRLLCLACARNDHIARVDPDRARLVNTDAALRPWRHHRLRGPNVRHFQHKTTPR